MRDLKKIQALVGDVTQNDLKHVDSYVCDDVGMFVPSTGFCGYAIRQGHTHPAYSFIVLLKKSDGVINATLHPDEDHYVAAILPPEITHEEKAGDEFARYIAIMASTQLVESVFENYGIVPFSARQWHEFFVPKEIMVFISRFMEEYETDPTGGEAILQALGFLIVNDLIKNAYGICERERLPKSSAVRNAVEYIHQNFSNPIPIEGLARNANLSVSAFSRKFSQETGASPAAYIVSIRLGKAKKLLRSSEQSITEIAQRCGFSSAAHLSSSFKKRCGVTPSEYRLLYANL